TEQNGTREGGREKRGRERERERGREGERERVREREREVRVLERQGEKRNCVGVCVSVCFWPVCHIGAPVSKPFLLSSRTHTHTHTLHSPSTRCVVQRLVDDPSLSFLFLFPGHLRLHSVSRVGTHVRNIHYVSAADSIYTQFVYTFMALLCVCV